MIETCRSTGIVNIMQRLFLLGACLLCFTLPLPAQNEKEQEVTKLDGTKVFGIVEITDDYTIRISSDSGLQKIPLALLSEKDFEKYTKTKDRSQDGRLWSERKNALEDKKSKDKNQSADIEIRLGEIAAFQPLIDAYEKSLADKKKSASSTDEKSRTGSKESTTTPLIQSLFSGPGTTLGGVPGAEAVSSVVAPAVSAGAGAVQSLAPTSP